MTPRRTARRQGPGIVPWGPLATCLAAVALVVPAAGCGLQQASDPATAAAPAGELIVRRGTFQGRFLMTGELQAVQSDRIVVPRTPVWQVPVRWIETDGIEVAAGQPVLELDNSQFTGDLEQNRLAESKALNDLRRKRAELAGTLADRQFQVDKARIDVDKAALVAEVPEELLPQREYQERRLALARAEKGLAQAEEVLASAVKEGEAELNVLQLALEQARNEIRVAERAIEQLTLTAPRAGIFVVEQSPQEGRKLQVGDTVWVGMTVATIPDLSRMKVVGQLSDVDDGRIAPGMLARCTLDTYPGVAYEGTVAEITPVAKEEDNQSLRRFFRASVNLDHGDPRRMRPGMSVKVEVLLPARQDVLLAPRRALAFGDGPEPPQLALAGGTTAEVTLGPCDAQHCVIEDGVAEGTPLEPAG